VPDKVRIPVIVSPAFATFSPTAAVIVTAKSSSSAIAAESSLSVFNNSGAPE